MALFNRLLKQWQADRRRKQFLAYKFKQLTDDTLIERMQ